MKNIYLLIAYDVSTESSEGRRRLRKIAQTCTNYGQRVQKSIFECLVSETEYTTLKHQLLREIDEAEDSLRIYRLRDHSEKTVQHYGINKPIDYTRPLIL
ncbi:CRISPR-associated endonuclease Cas2 [Tumebacillus lipolyticus]|uniref:CRISPR-associated endoribonuclease Cas2 n=1 Tax=Tumebacillus lipolyticus TaxID=1280370 RepID=A0ABW4ZY82_9BACL